MNPAHLADSPGNTDEDEDFVPVGVEDSGSLDELDDEATIEEEEGLSNEESMGDELDVLQREGDLPLDALMAKYGYANGLPPGPAGDSSAVGPSSSALHTVDEQISSQGSGGDKLHTGQQLGGGEIDSGAPSSTVLDENVLMDKTELDMLGLGADGHSHGSAEDLMDSVETSATARLLGEVISVDSSDGSEDAEYIPVVVGAPAAPAPKPSDDPDDLPTSPQYIQVGPDFQAKIPDLLPPDTEPGADYLYSDNLLWSPGVVSESQVVEFLKAGMAQLRASMAENNPPEDDLVFGLEPDETCVVADNEKLLFKLYQCGYRCDEALRRLKMDPGESMGSQSETVRSLELTRKSNSSTALLALWTPDEVRQFENGLTEIGKNFFMIRQSKVRTKSVSDLVQFYYMWKKTRRGDVIANKSRPDKRKYSLRPGRTDYLGRCLDESDLSDPEPLVAIDGATLNPPQLLPVPIECASRLPVASMADSSVIPISGPTPASADPSNLNSVGNANSCGNDATAVSSVAASSSTSDGVAPHLIEDRGASFSESRAAAVARALDRGGAANAP